MKLLVLGVRSDDEGETVKTGETRCERAKKKKIGFKTKDPSIGTD